MDDNSTAVNVLLFLGVTLPLILLEVAAFIDLYRRKELSLVRKLIWVAIVILTAYIGLVIYYAMRPPAVPKGKEHGATDGRTARIVSGLDELRGDHSADRIDDETYLARKRELLGLTAT